MSHFYFTREQLASICEVKKMHNIDKFFLLLVDFMKLTHIDTTLRAAAFIATIAHESCRFVYTEERAKGVLYEGREDLGNVHPGDGPKYKGRGLIQVTGRYNYEHLSIDFGEDFINYPEKLAEPYYAVMSACWFWNRKNLNELADRGEFKAITKKVNGGLNGWSDRRHLYERAKMILK